MPLPPFLCRSSKVDSFLFNWAPRADLRKELLRLYRPFRHRFESQEAWLPRFEAAIRAVGGGHESIHPYSLSLYVSISLALEMVRAQEATRGFRYSRVVACRPDTLIHRVSANRKNMCVDRTR